MKTKTKEKVKARVEAKKAAVKAKVAAKKIRIKSKLGALTVLALMLSLCGCAFERADPAARSNRAIYTITVTAHGDNSKASAYIKDGLMATADGEGAITQPSTQSAEQSPDVTVPGDVVSAGIQAVGHVAGKAIDAYAAKQSKDAKAAEAVKDCANCTDGSCEDCVKCTDCEVK